MVIYDVFIEDKKDDADLVVAIGRILGVEEKCIAILDDMEQSVEKDPSNLFILLESVGGEFETYLVVYAGERPHGPTVDRFAQLMAARMGCRLVYCSGSDNPYEWIRVSAAGDQQAVLLMDEPLDNNNEVVLAAPEYWPAS